MYTKHCYMLKKGDTKGSEIQILLTERNYLENDKYAHNHKVWRNVSGEQMKETFYV